MAKKVDIPVSKYKCNTASITINYVVDGKPASISISKGEVKELPNIPTVKSFADRGYLTMEKAEKAIEKTDAKFADKPADNTTDKKESK